MVAFENSNSQKGRETATDHRQEHEIWSVRLDFEIWSVRLDFFLIN